MQTKYNFVSVVILGRFNPSILTIDFLSEVCLLGLVGGKSMTPPELPFPKEVLFEEDKLSFFVDLDRMQIKQAMTEGLTKNSLTKYAKVYLEKLPYTPIFSAGINFNLLMTLDSDEEGEKLYKLMSDENDIFRRLNTNKFTLNTERHYAKGNAPIYKMFILSHPKDEILYSSIRIWLRGNNRYEINHNIEIKTLKDGSQNKNLILDGYDDIEIYHKQIMNTFFEG